MRRLSMILGVAAATLVLTLPAHAVADPAPVAVTGSASPARLAGPGPVTFTYTVVISGAPATGVVLTTGQDPVLPADIASVRFDGAAVPAATITAAAPNFTLRAGVGADAGAGGTVGLGTHTLTFTATAPSSTPAQASSTLTVTTDQNTTTSAPVVVAVNQPDFALTIPADSGEDQPAPLGTGSVISFVAELRNLGAPSAGTVTVTLPTGLRLGPNGVARYADQVAYDEDNGTTLPCSGSLGTITCTLDTVATTGSAEPAIIEVELMATSAGRPGASAPFTVSATPATGTDLNPADNSVGATIIFAGIANLSYTVTPDKAKVQLGHKATLTLRVTNHGPQPAPMTLALSLLDGTDHFIVTGFDGATTPPGATGLGRTAAIRTAHRNLAAALVRHTTQAGSVPTRTGLDTTSPHGVVWFIGTVQPGATATAHLTVQAEALGTARLILLAVSRAGDPDCVNEDDPCLPALATLTATPAVALPAPAVHTRTPIANTGSPDIDLTLLGAGLVLAGAALTRTGRRRTLRAS